MLTATLDCKMLYKACALRTADLAMLNATKAQQAESIKREAGKFLHYRAKRDSIWRVRTTG